MKQFIAIWLGELCSRVGSGMTAFAISIYVYQETGSATWVSIVALLAYLPTILMNPIGGILADRYDRRVMMICSDLFSVIGLLVIFFSTHVGNIGVIPICIGVFLSSIFAGIFEPAFKATVTDLLSEDEYAKASGMVMLASSSNYLISPFIAGLILSIWDIRAILIIDMATFFITVFATASVRKYVKVRKVSKVRKETFHFLQEFREGIESISQDKGVITLIVLMAFMCFFIAFIQTLLSPMILSFADAKTLGMLESVSAIGMIVGSIMIGIFKSKKNYDKILMISLMAAGFFMAMTGTTENIWLILMFCTLFFTTLPFINTCADVMIRKRIPNHVQGRAWGIISVLTQVGYVIAYAVCGAAADYVFGPMFMENGLLVDSVGRVIGTGKGRGIGFMLILAGGLMLSLAFIIGSFKSFRKMGRSLDELAHH